MTPDVLDALRVCAGLALLALVVAAPAYLLTDWLHRSDRKPRTTTTTGRIDR